MPEPKLTRAQTALGFADFIESHWIDLLGTFFIVLGFFAGSFSANERHSDMADKVFVLGAGIIGGSEARKWKQRRK